jgi:protein TonB
MFSNLVESKRKKGRRRGGMVMSFVAHYGLILGALYTSARAESITDAPRAQKVNFMAPPEPVKKDPAPTAPELVAVPQVPKTSPVLVAPVDIPSALPEIDLTQRITDPNDFATRATTKAGPAVTPGTGDAPLDREHFDFEVEKPATQAPNSAAPAYPDMLRQAGVEGEALVSFVVDTAGRVDLSTFKVVRASHDAFANAVKLALPRMRFFPAEIGNRKVRQLVQQPFSFAIVK